MEFSHFFLTFVLRKESKTMAKEKTTKIWVRLGGYVECTPASAERIKGGDTDALMNAIHEYGFEVNGETYIPETDTEFEINPEKI